VDEYFWTITRAPNGDKTFTISAEQCVVLTAKYGGAPEFLVLNFLPEGGIICHQLSYQNAITLAPVTVALTAFYNLAPGQVAHTIVDVPFATAHPKLTSVSPATPQDAQMIYFDGITNGLVNVNLATGITLSQYTIPTFTQVSVFGIRPSVTGASNEVWAVAPQTIYVVNTANGTLSGSIPLPSLASTAANPAGIVFTNSGATALYAVGYDSPDSAGNNGALLLFDVASRTLKSTFLLKYAPTAIVMAPDGLTAYLIGAGKITYYDMFSGTADLTAPFPLLITGQQVFIHPDGTRLFFNTNYVLNVFDLTTRKVVSQFNSGLPSTGGTTMQMSPDGSNVWFSNAGGTLAIMDTRYGVVLGMPTASPQTSVYPGPAN
jgi:hypothetical protein